ncbi:chaperone protein DnaJ [bacterium BMS3Abin05]|nr:chaperone protein DnaJ [bacterium BMS3Abin05]
MKDWPQQLWPFDKMENFLVSGWPIIIFAKEKVTLLSQPKYKSIVKAAQTLEISTALTREQIRQKYREIVKQWHPDKSDENSQERNEMMAKINEAYKIILDYLENYRYSFTEEEVKENLPVDSQDWWSDRFGDDPLWGRRS